jgi:hypothetical protein
MKRAGVLGAGAVAVAIAAIGAAWWAVRQPAVPAEQPAAIAGAAGAGLLTAIPIGVPPRGEERPQITHVAIADLDRDGLNDVLVCDALKNQVTWIRQAPRGTFSEQTIAGVSAPAHVEVIDFDGDGDLDLVVAALGFLFPNNSPVGSVIVMENDGQQRFRSHYVADRIARVADARAADFDGDGDLDISVAGFGYDDGETSWLENLGGWTFQQHVLQRLAGGINAVPADINGDGAPDIVALISQEFEEIWAFLNDGRGGFTPSLIWGATNPDFGSSWLSMRDLDRDGDLDILYANGDAFEYAPPNSRPWQGVQWLENTAPRRGDPSGPPAPAAPRPPAFELHRIADLQGATSPESVDLDGDGDLDVLLVTANNDWDDPRAPSLLWLENDGRMQFTLRGIAGAPTHLQTLAVGDLDGDGRPDAVTGGMHISRPYDRIGRVTAWQRRGVQAAR